MKQYTQYNPSTWRKSVFGRLGGVVCACMGMHANISTLVQGIKRTKAIILKMLTAEGQDRSSRGLRGINYYVKNN